MTIIYPPDIGDGSYLNWERWDVRVNGTVDITDEQPRSGNGSAEFNLTSGSDKAGLATLFAEGDTSHKLADLTEASYDWYRDSSSTNPAVQQPALKLFVDGDGNLATTADRCTLIYEEAYNSYPGPVPTDSWVHSNATSGNWWIFHSASSGYPGAPGVVPVYDKTFAEWISQDVTSGGWTDPIGANTVVLGVSVEVGSGWNGVSQMFADNIVVTFGNASDVIANFEVLPPLPDCAPDVLDNLTATLGTPGADTLIGGAGTDFIRGLDGPDVLKGKGGADYLFGEGDGDKLYGGGGKDFLDGGAGADFIYGEGGNDILKGDSCEDVGGKDRMYGGDGKDSIDGDGGNDQIWGGADNDSIDGGDGNDELRGEGGSDVIDGGDDDDTAWGGAGKDLIYGGSGKDVLNGDSGDDEIHGGSSADRINGGSGNDELWGDGGTDRFVWTSAPASGAGGQEHDTVSDWELGEKIDLTALDLTAGQISVAGNSTGTSNGNPNGREIYVDIDGKGGANAAGAELVITVLFDDPTFEAKDFVMSVGSSGINDVLI